jgi:hypothetical protein
VSIFVGQSLDVTFTCTNRANELFDATTLTCRVEKPDGTFTVYTYGTDLQLVRISTGVYRITVTVDQAGEWWFRGNFTHTSGGATVSGTSREIPRTVTPTR